MPALYDPLNHAPMGTGQPILYLDKIFFKQKTAYEITYGDWSSDMCSSDLLLVPGQQPDDLHAWIPIHEPRGLRRNRPGSEVCAHANPICACTVHASCPFPASWTTTTEPRLPCSAHMRISSKRTSMSLSRMTRSAAFMWAGGGRGGLGWAGGCRHWRFDSKPRYSHAVRSRWLVIRPTPTPVSRTTAGWSMRWSMPTNRHTSCSGDHASQDSHPCWACRVNCCSSCM